MPQMSQYGSIGTGTSRTNDVFHLNNVDEEWIIDNEHKQRPIYGSTEKINRFPLWKNLTLFGICLIIVLAASKLISSDGSLLSIPVMGSQQNIEPFKSSMGSGDSYWTPTSTTVKQLIGNAAQPWKIYKRTMNANEGSSDDLYDLLTSFFAYSYNSSFGCSSGKLVAEIAENSITAEEFHFVDSNVFYDSPDKPVEVWNEVIEDLGFETYNVFMNNYVQLYSTNLTPVLQAIKAKGFTDYFGRLSYTPLSTEVNVAHIVIFLAQGGIYIDVTGPIDTLPTDFVSEFTLWSENECAGAHQLKWELSEYDDLLESSQTPNSEWETTTGMKTPLFISTGIPVTSLSKVDDIFTIAGAITSLTDTTVTYDTCSYREMVVTSNTDGVQSTVVRYILHESAVDGPTGYQLADWESIYDEVYDYQKQHDLKGEATWSRYMDYHIGLMSPSTEKCETSIELINLAHGTVSTSYVVSKRGWLHYYTGVPGVVSWEYNASECTTVESDDICGCMENNSYNSYYNLYGLACY